MLQSASGYAGARKTAYLFGLSLQGRVPMVAILLLAVFAVEAAAGKKDGKKHPPAATTAWTNPIPLPIWPEAKRQEPQIVAAEIDRLIEVRLANEKVPPSPITEDAEFLRRVHLDLIGRIPTPDRAVAFLDSKETNKRSKLIDELLASPEYGKHFGNVWHDLIVPRTSINAKINPEALRAAFTDCFNANLPWSEVSARLTLCQGGTKEKNFLAFHQVNGDMGGNPMANVVARSFSRLLLGVRMECAECHTASRFSWWTGKRGRSRTCSTNRCIKN